jgi:uncharacterized protein YbaP (TraB family)
MVGGSYVVAVGDVHERGQEGVVEEIQDVY